ncbi:MAG: c-type cytochrome biogenesis protein CcsB [Deltaproteobacteria bacterium]|nr:c-type cytochrome biogenesis protein CcsB [Deltaproteobacteria bacterium]
MNSWLLLTIILYFFSTAGYLAFLFRQKERLNKIGFYLLLAGLLMHTVSIVYASMAIGQLPVKSLGATLSIAGWAVAALFILFQLKYNLKILGVYAAPLCALITAASAFVSTKPAQADSILGSYWIVFHIITVFLGDAAFALACGLGIIYLIQERSIKDKRHGFFFKRLPSLELIDASGYTCIVIGFTLLTVGLFSGFIYAKAVWGRFWSWDPKEVWSGVTWLLYAALLHGRVSLGWRGRKAAFMAVIGFIVLMFTFFGVNFLLKGHHGPFTQM